MNTLNIEWFIAVGTGWTDGRVPVASSWLNICRWSNSVARNVVSVSVRFSRRSSRCSSTSGKTRSVIVIDTLVVVSSVEFLGEVIRFCKVAECSLQATHGSVLREQRCSVLRQFTSSTMEAFPAREVVRKLSTITVTGVFAFYFVFSLDEVIGRSSRFDSAICDELLASHCIEDWPTNRDGDSVLAVPTILLVSRTRT